MNWRSEFAGFTIDKICLWLNRTAGSQAVGTEVCITGQSRSSAGLSNAAFAAAFIFNVGSKTQNKEHCLVYNMLIPSSDFMSSLSNVCCIAGEKHPSFPSGMNQLNQIKQMYKYQ